MRHGEAGAVPPSFVSGSLLSAPAAVFFRASDQPPGYLVAGIESQPLNLDPRFATDANAVRVGGLIYNSLLRADEHGQLKMELAERWQMIDAGLTS